MHTFKPASKKDIEKLWSLGKTFRGHTSIAMHDITMENIPSSFAPTQWANDCLVFSRKMSKYTEGEIGQREFLGSFEISLFVKLEKIKTDDGDIPLPEFIKNAKIIEKNVGLENAIEYCQRHGVSVKWLDFKFDEKSKLPF